MKLLKKYKILSVILLAILFIPNLIFAAPPQYSANNFKNKEPLLIIRFNKPQVNFEKPLFQSIKKATDMKKNVKFTFVTFIPATHNQKIEKKMEELAVQKTEEVLNEVEKIGAKNYDNLYVRSPHTKYTEIFMFVS